jgi:hypothetical protein
MNAATQEDSDLSSLLQMLEKQLMDPAFRRNRESVSALLAADFREFGSSGCEWSREAILDLLANEDSYTVPEVEDFTIRRIAPDAALVTYRTLRLNPKTVTLRSSLWVQSEQGWQVLFHQGTKAPGA